MYYPDNGQNLLKITEFQVQNKKYKFDFSQTLIKNKVKGVFCQIIYLNSSSKRQEGLLKHAPFRACLKENKRILLGIEYAATKFQCHKYHGK